MINLAQEESYKLSAKDRYDIYTFAIEAADDGGFVSSFIFERAIYLYAAIILKEDRANEIREKITQNLIEAWDYVIQEKIIQEMLEEYADDLNRLAEESKIWFKEYTDYTLSARGILSIIEEFSGDIINSTVDTFKTTVQETGVKEIIDIADEWGMNRQTFKPQKVEKQYEEKDIESLFE